ncbi:MAG: hypothetical protein JWM94_227 [Sphingomonas bacterium]|nr:hypothetical protein [Sphingomonas bacterium]
MRSDYGPNKVSLRLAFRPFVDMFQFRGRSTRTEVLSFWLLGLLSSLIYFLYSYPPSAFERVIESIWFVLWNWPWIPLLVRRLHDQSRSGRWAALPLIAVTLFALNWWFAPAGNDLDMNLAPGPINLHRTIGWSPLTITSSIVFVAIIIANFAFYLLPGTGGANRFGPDPRLDAQPALALAET